VPRKIQGNKNFGAKYFDHLTFLKIEENEKPKKIEIKN
jgi:hypothetical protein